MRKVKWIFFAYLALVGGLVVALGISVSITSPRDPQTLYSIYEANLRSLDPAICNDTVGSAILSNVYECLYSYRYPAPPYVLFPQLAEEMPKISEDGLTYTIKLRKGIRFYDPGRRAFPKGIGPEMKASDVIHSWKRVANFHLAAPNFSTIFQDKIVGLDDFNKYTESTPREKVDYDRPVEGLQALDDYTLQIKLLRPAPQFIYQLAHGGSAIVSRAGAEIYGEGLKEHPVATGPYIMTEYLQDQRLVFEANPAYRGRPDVDGYAKVSDADRLPKIKRMRYDYFRERIPSWHLFNQKLYDVLERIPKESFDSAVDPETQELTQEMKDKGIKLIKTTEASMYYWGFNFNDKIVGKNKPLRQAMSMAYDRDKFIKVYRNGRGIPMNGPIPPGFPTYDKNFKNPYTTFNLPAARALMQQAQRINGGPLPTLAVLMQDTDSATRQMAEFFSNQMRQIGLTVKPDYATWARFQELVDARETQIFSAGWAADYPDEQTFLMLFYGKFAPPGGVNPCGYVNPEYDKLYEKASVMNASPEREKLYRQMRSEERRVGKECRSRWSPYH